MENKEINNKVEESQLRQKCNFRGNRNLRFVVGDDVMIRNYVSSPKWVSATVIEVLSPVTYLVKTKFGLTKRHVDQIRKMLIDSHDWTTSDLGKDKFVFPPSPQLELNKPKPTASCNPSTSSKPTTPPRVDKPAIGTPTSRYKIPSPNILSRPKRTIKPRVIFNV